MVKQQWEEETIERFRGYLSQNRNTTYGITGRDVVVDKRTGGNFDYQLQNEKGEKIAVELFRMVENGEDLAKSRVWYKVVGFLRDAVQRRGLKGYLVYTPQFFVKKSEMKVYSEKMAEVIEKGIRFNTTAKEFVHDGFKFHKVESFDTISLSYSDGVRSVDSRRTAINSFVRLLPKKNKQVNIANHERLLVVVKWAYFVDSHAAIGALTTLDFNQFTNIDKIFFEEKEGEFVLIYDHSVIDAIKSRTEIKNPDSHKLLVEYLKNKLDDRNHNAFDYIKTIGTRVGNLEWLPKDTKENLIHFGKTFSVGQIEDAMWIVRMLNNDQNPNPTGANDLDDPEGKHNYHSDVVRNEDVRNITTIRGHLCWLMSHIVAKNKPQYYTEIISILTRYIREGNLYMRIQATYPLVELIVRGKATKNQDESPFEWKQEERDLVRDLPLNMLRENAAHPRVQKAILYMFDKLRDLNEAEAEEVLSAFVSIDDSDVLHDLAALLPYFALFRKGDFPEESPFNPSASITLLKEQIVNGKTALKSSLAWHFWKMLEEKSIPYKDIREYMLLFWGNEYDPSTAHMFGLIIRQLADISPGDAKDFFEKIANLLKEYLLKHPEERHQVWLDDTDHALILFVSEPNRLLRLIGTLKDIWMVGGTYIGNMSLIFGSHEKVPGGDKERVKFELKRMYDEMKTVQPLLQPIDWNRN